MTLSVSVILSTHDRPDSLLRAAESVFAQGRAPEQVIVINDGQQDVPDEIGRHADSLGIRYVQNRLDRPSLPASRNAGIDAADGGVLLLLDDDVVLPEDYLARLVDLYEADGDGVVAAIGGVFVLPETCRTFSRRAWEFCATLLGEQGLGPRVRRARYVSLPPRLRGRLVPARRLTGGTISLRRSAIGAERFDDAFSGYALGEDLEFGFRLMQKAPVFTAPSMMIHHAVAPGGRPDVRRRGQAYAANLLYIVRNTLEPGVGGAVSAGFHLAGLTLLGAVWSLFSRRRRSLQLAVGIAGELLKTGRRHVKEMLCGS